MLQLCDMKQQKNINALVWSIILIAVIVFIVNTTVGDKKQSRSLPTIVSSPVTSPQLSLPTTIISISDSSSQGISAFIADNEAAREKGLGDITSLDESSGMIFVFPVPTSPYFWMKDTLIPLDMVWIDQNKKVVGVSEDIATSTFPKTFSPTSQVLYVLEINAGAAKKIGIATGTQLQFDIVQKNSVDKGTLMQGQPVSFGYGAVLACG